MPDLPTTANGRFRPATAEDHTRYARHLGKLIDLPLQRAQQLLARAYGYADLHELREVLKQPGTPGPYEDEASLDLPAGLAELLEGETGSVVPRELLEILNVDFQARSRLLLKLASQVEGVRSERVDHRALCLVPAAGFFCSPRAHRT